MLKQLRLNTLENTKRSYNRIIRAYQHEEIDASRARTLAYMLNGVLAYWKLQADLRLEDEIAELREYVGLKGGRKFEKFAS